MNLTSKANIKGNKKLHRYKDDINGWKQVKTQDTHTKMEEREPETF